MIGKIHFPGPPCTRFSVAAESRGGSPTHLESMAFKNSLDLIAMVTALVTTLLAFVAFSVVLAVVGVVVGIGQERTASWGAEKILPPKIGQQTLRVS